MIIQPAERLLSVSEYYFSKKLKELDALKKSGAAIINLGIGSPDLAPEPDTVAALIEESKKEDVHGYQSYIGIPELRSAMATWMASTFGTELFDSSNEILPLAGSKEGIMHISMAFLNPGDAVLIPDPGYPTYSSVSQLCQATPIRYSLTEKNGYQIDFDALEKQDLSQVKIIWVNYPHMPTGTRATSETFVELIKFAKKHQILIVHDNPYSLILNEQPTSIFNFEGSKEVALELHSLSKSHNMAGWRIGWVCGESSYLKEILKFKSNMDSGIFRPLQIAAVEALTKGIELRDQNNHIYLERKVLALKILDVLGCTYQPDTSGMFVWGKLPKDQDADALVDDLLNNKHIFITPGHIFGENGNGFIRISLCQNKTTLLKALQRLQT